MSHQNDSYRKPPEASSIQRHIRLYIFQYVGFPLLLLVPILAVFGVFGESFTEIQQNNDDLSVTVHYPTRYRYKMINTMTVTVQNTTEQSMSLLTLSVSRNYIAQFSTVNFLPAVTQINNEVYEVELKNLAPGETRIVSIELQAESYGMHNGTINISGENVETMSLSISTLIFP